MSSASQAVIGLPTHTPIRLLHVVTRQFQIFQGAGVPSYIAASHRWTKDEHEYPSRAMDDSSRLLVHKKILGFCEVIRNYRRDIHWLWIDSCCIDRKNEQELEDAINSMFQWYRNAEACYAYLWDVRSYADSESNDKDSESSGEDLESSKWFKRGWTLQELLAPNVVVFFSRSWQLLGHKCPTGHGQYDHAMYRPNINAQLERATGIRTPILENFDQVKKVTAGEVVSWMANRQTTKKEDMWYSLIGIFGVTMHTRYGEGAERAKHRLTMAIIEAKRSTKSGPSVARRTAESTDTLQASNRGSDWRETPVQVRWYEDSTTTRPQRIMTRYKDPTQSSSLNRIELASSTQHSHALPIRSARDAKSIKGRHHVPGAPSLSTQSQEVQNQARAAVQRLMAQGQSQEEAVRIVMAHLARMQRRDSDDSGGADQKRSRPQRPLTDREDARSLHGQQKPDDSGEELDEDSQDERNEESDESDEDDDEDDSD